jgi:hypothetical protein
MSPAEESSVGWVVVESGSAITGRTSAADDVDRP